MFSWKKNKFNNSTLEDIKDLLSQLQLQVNGRFKEINSQISQLDQKIELLHQTLNKKEFSDKQQYGHLKYQINQLDFQFQKKKDD